MCVVKNYQGVNQEEEKTDRIQKTDSSTGQR